MILFAGCNFQPSAKEKVWEVLPEELKDCKFYNLTDSKGNFMRVVRCPLSSTTIQYQNGKTQEIAVIIDGQEYIKK